DNRGESRWAPFTSKKIGNRRRSITMTCSFGRRSRKAMPFAGLLVVSSHDLEGDLFWDDSWEIWHQETGLFMLELRAPLERVLVIATDLASKADWSIMNEHDVDSHPMRFNLMAFASGYPTKVVMPADDIDDDVPYRDQN